MVLGTLFTTNGWSPACLCSRSALVTSRFALTVSILGTVFLGLVSGCGIMAALGVQFDVIIVAVVPLVVLGVGLDDSFVALASLDVLPQSLAPHERVAMMMVHVFRGITLTSATTVVALLLGLFSRIPAIRSFCLYTASSIVMVWVYVASTAARDVAAAPTLTKRATLCVRGCVAVCLCLCGCLRGCVCVVPVCRTSYMVKVFPAIVALDRARASASRADCCCCFRFRNAKDLSHRLRAAEYLAGTGKSGGAAPVSPAGGGTPGGTGLRQARILIADLADESTQLQWATKRPDNNGVAGTPHPSPDAGLEMKLEPMSAVEAHDADSAGPAPDADVEAATPLAPVAPVKLRSWQDAFWTKLGQGLGGRLGRTAVFLVTLAVVAVAAWGSSTLRVEFSLQAIVPDGSYVG